jgi:hypothetical protein
VVVGARVAEMYVYRFGGRYPAVVCRDRVWARRKKIQKKMISDDDVIDEDLLVLIKPNNEDQRELPLQASQKKLDGPELDRNFCLLSPRGLDLKQMLLSRTEEDAAETATALFSMLEVKQCVEEYCQFGEGSFHLARSTGENVECSPVNI